jgi:hypothetical protein
MLEGYAKYFQVASSFEGNATMLVILNRVIIQYSGNNVPSSSYIIESLTLKFMIPFIAQLVGELCLIVAVKD